MDKQQIEAWMQAVDTYLQVLHRDLDERLSVFSVPAPPRLADFA